MKYVVMGLGILLTACASTSVPDGFLYETSVRGEQGWQGASARAKAAESLTKAGVVVHPAAALQRALPSAEVKVKRWGVSYFGADWTRYQVKLDADVTQAGRTNKCRMRAPDTPVGAMSLKEIRADDGAALQQALQELVSACVAQVKAG